MKKCYICKKSIGGGLRPRCDGENKYAHETCVYISSEIVARPWNVTEYAPSGSGLSRKEQLRAIAKNIVGDIDE